MPHFTNQHDPDQAEKTVTISEKQFQILVDMLTPGYELSSLMLAEYKAKHETADKSEASGGAVT